MIADAIVAIPGATPLANLLTAIHRNRLGHVSRVLKADRRPLLQQLQSAGVPTGHAPAVLAASDRLVLVFAAARSEQGAQLLLRNGAERVWTVSRNGIWSELDDQLIDPVTPSPQLSLPTAGDTATT